MVEVLITWRRPHDRMKTAGARPLMPRRGCNTLMNTGASPTTAGRNTSGPSRPSAAKSTSPTRAKMIAHDEEKARPGEETEVIVPSSNPTIHGASLIWFLEPRFLALAGLHFFDGRALARAIQEKIFQDIVTICGSERLSTCPATHGRMSGSWGCVHADNLVSRLALGTYKIGWTVSCHLIVTKSPRAPGGPTTTTVALALLLKRVVGALRAASTTKKRTRAPRQMGRAGRPWIVIDGITWALAQRAVPAPQRVAEMKREGAHDSSPQFGICLESSCESVVSTSGPAFGFGTSPDNPATPLRRTSGAAGGELVASTDAAPAFGPARV